MGSLVNSTKHLREKKIVPMLYNLFQIIEAGRILTDLFQEASITLIPNPCRDIPRKLEINISYEHKRASQVVLVVKNPPVNEGDVRDVGLIPGSGRSLGRGHSNRLQYSCLENPRDRGAWQTTVHRVTKESHTTEATQHACT